VRPFPKTAEVDMRYTMIGIALFGFTLVTSAPAQITTHSTSAAGTMVAGATLAGVTDVPLYIRVIDTTLYFGEVRGFSAGDGILYQVSGTSSLSVGGGANSIRPGEAIFVPGAKDLVLKAEPGEPSIFLRFLLSPAANLDLPDFTFATGREIYRSTAPIQGLKQGKYLLSLTRVILPPQTPLDPLHHRSGVALHYVLSGQAIQVISGKTITRKTGAVSYEPANMLYAWGNLGNVPLTYLVFNLSPEN